MTTLLRLVRKVRIRLLWLGAALLAGLLVHIGVVLAITHQSLDPSIAALSRLGVANAMIVLPPVTGGHQPVAFLSPADRYAICPFDLRKGPVALHAVLGGDDWMVAVYGPSGVNEFAVAGADLGRREVELMLSTSGEGQGTSLPITRDASVTTAVGLPARIGVVVISAPAEQLDEASVTSQLLAEASCTPRARPMAAPG